MTPRFAELVHVVHDLLVHAGAAALVGHARGVPSRLSMGAMLPTLGKLAIMSSSSSVPLVNTWK